MYINHNLVKNTGNFGSGFFPDFPDPVFSRKKNCADLRKVKQSAILMANNICIISQKIYYVEKCGEYEKHLGTK